MIAREYRLSRSHPFDPPELLREFRRRPIGKVTMDDGTQAWLVTRHQDVSAILRDPRFSSHGGYNNLSSPSAKQVGAWEYTSSFGHMDGAGHARTRHILAEGFSPKRIDALRPRLERIVHMCIDRLLEAGPPADLHKAFSMRVAGQVVGVVVGMPADYRRAIDEYMDILAAVMEAPSPRAKKRYTAKLIELYHRCAQLLRQPHEEPAETPFARVHSAWREGRLTDHEACSALTNLTAIGHPISASSISLSTLMLLQRPELARVIGGKGHAARAAVDELLRYHTPLNWGIPRTAAEDVPLDGVVIRKGDKVMISLTSANRDESVVRDPDAFDVDRDDVRRHVTFGDGPHICLGQWLARVEVEIAISALATRMPTLRLAVPLEEIRFTENTYLFSVERLPITW